MTSRMITALKAVGLAAALTISTLPAFALTPDPAIKSMSVTQLIAARQAAMEDNERLLRKAKSLAGDDAVAAATEILQNFTNFPSLFAEGSTGGKSHAKPAIWTNWADFTARIAADTASAKAMLKAATDADDDAYFAAISEISGSCRSCHSAYRAP